MLPACLVVMEEDIRIQVTQTGTTLRFRGILKDPFECVIWGWGHYFISLSSYS